jgi:steroid delta-isomerase-like uncharacterized protein
MSEDLITLAREEIEAFSEGDWERMAAALAPDCVHEELGTGRTVRGVDEILELNREWKATYPDARGTVTDAFACGDRVALEITWEGTQSGELSLGEGSIQPTNRQVTVQAIEVFRILDGKIVESRHAFDVLGMLEQLGTVSPEAFAQSG